MKLILYNTRSGLLKADYHEGEIGLDFPAIPQKQIKYPKELIDAIGGVEPKYVGMPAKEFCVVPPEQLLENQGWD